MIRHTDNCTDNPHLHQNKVPTHGVVLMSVPPETAITTAMITIHLREADPRSAAALASYAGQPGPGDESDG